MKKLNLIFLGGFPYPHGMAGTKRIQHAIDGIRSVEDVAIRVIILRQSSKVNVLSGCQNGIEYETVMGFLHRVQMVLLLPAFYFKSRRAMKRAYHYGFNNVIYNYGPPDLFNIVALSYARHLGYKIVFDIVEDYGSAVNISRSLLHRIKMRGIEHFSRRIKDMSSGIIVLSSHLQQKYEKLTKGETPIYFRPISVDFDCYPLNVEHFGKTLILFYAGSFGKKDGVPVLLDAFDKLAAKHELIRLVLTGKGSDEDIFPVLSRIAKSPYKDRIEYKGYLDDESYHKVLRSADITCMTRIDSAYANAGFPFKLGEFLATGKPVIASRVSDIEQFLEDRNDAMLVKPGSSIEIVAAVEYLLSKPQVADAIGKRGRIKAKMHFDYKEQARGLLDYIRSI